MSIDNELLKEFAQITNDTQTTKENTYLRGTIVSNSGGKYVQIDGSSTATPITETVNVEEGDRVLVSIENHKATIVGNFTFPPSARKEQEALDQAGAAQESADNANTTANVAQEKAQEASTKADTAISQSSVASASADEAKQQAKDAIATANTASTNASEAKTLATQASTEATEAKQQAAESLAASADAQAEVAELQNEVKAAQEDADKALTDLETQASEISSIKETYATKVEVGNTKAELETTITTKVGELETTISETYSTKTENVELEGRLQSQITQNAEGLASQVTKTEKLEADTAQAQEDVAKALSQAAAAQTSADNAQSTADAAQIVADNAQTAADNAAANATIAQNAADLAQQAADAADEKVQSAQSDLNEAKQNLANVTSRVDATEADIADAQAKVDAAQTSVNQALADAAEANLAATKAQQAADKAQEDAENAQGAADTAQQKADNAQTAANNAQEAANKAQADVAALTSRVTTAETTISQNSENITLNATKITEIGEQADTTDTNLTNNYYTKTETDAKIEIESDRITSTVSKVETVEQAVINAQSTADAAQEDIDNFEIGGTNLLLNSELGYPFTNCGYKAVDSDGEYIELYDKTIKTPSSGYNAAYSYCYINDNISSPLSDLSIKNDCPLTFSVDVKVNGDFNNLRLGINAIYDNTVLFHPIANVSDHCTQNSWFRISGTSQLSKIKQIFDYTDIYDKTEGITVDDEGWITVYFNNLDGEADETFIYWTNPIALANDTDYNIFLEVKKVYGDAYICPIISSGSQFTDGWAVNFTDLTDGTILNNICSSKSDFNTSNHALGTFVHYDAGTWGSITFRLSVIEDTTITPDTFIYKEYRDTSAATVDNITLYAAWDSVGYDHMDLEEYSIEYRLPKLEFSSKPTEWSPAPTDVTNSIEDLEDTMTNRLDTIDTSIQSAQSTIDQLSNMISHLVTDSNGESLMTQTSDGWTFNMSSINDNLDTIKDAMSNMENNSEETNSALERLSNLVNDVVNKTAYIIMSTDENGDPCIELGKSGNPFKVRITNTAIDFLEGSARIAYANNNTFYTEKIIVKNELQIGETVGFVWKTRANGNCGIAPIKA